MTIVEGLIGIPWRRQRARESAGCIRSDLHMLDGIQAYLESPMREGNHVRLDSMEFTGSDCVLALADTDHSKQETWRRWVVRAKVVLDYEIRDAHGGLSVHGGEHVLARQHTDPRVVLHFRGVPRSAVEVLGGLVAAHNEVAEDWIPFARYAYQGIQFEELLVRGYGMMASGPSFLVEAYASVLELHGMAPSMASTSEARHWNGSLWVEGPPRLAVLVVGESFVVAENFEEVPAAGKAARTDPVERDR